MVNLAFIKLRIKLIDTEKGLADVGYWGTWAKCSKRVKKYKLPAIGKKVNKSWRSNVQHGDNS